MDVSVRELRNHTARVIRAVESGETVVLTVHGKAVADVVPRVTRSERRSSEVLLAELAELSRYAREHEITSDPADFETGWTTDDLAP